VRGYIKLSHLVRAYFSLRRREKGDRREKVFVEEGVLFVN